MDTKSLREKFNMSQRDFSNFFDVPYGTVKNWDARSCAPVYFVILCERFLALYYRCIEGGCFYEYDKKGDS